MRRVINDYPFTFTARVGTLLRPAFRRALFARDIAFQEQRSLVDSLFRVTVKSAAEGRFVQTVIRQLNPPS